MSLFDSTMLQNSPQVSHPSQDCLSFPQSLTEKYRPRLLTEFVGLEKPKRFLQNLAANPKSINLLFRGPSGTGKTTAALALAEAIPAELHHIPSQECTLERIQRVRQTCQYFPAEGKRFHLVLGDEADQMTNAAQIALLSKLDSTDAAPNTIWVFTCNDTERLEPRFLSRCKVLDFSSYGMAEEASCLLQRLWFAEGGRSDNAPNFARIVKDAKNNVRAAINALETELMML